MKSQLKQSSWGMLLLYALLLATLTINNKVEGQSLSDRIGCKCRFEIVYNVNTAGSISKGTQVQIVTFDTNGLVIVYSGFNSSLTDTLTRIEHPTIFAKYYLDNGTYYNIVNNDTLPILDPKYFKTKKTTYSPYYKFKLDGNDWALRLGRTIIIPDTTIYLSKKELFRYFYYSEIKFMEDTIAKSLTTLDTGHPFSLEGTNSFLFDPKIAWFYMFTFSPVLKYEFNKFYEFGDCSFVHNQFKKW